MKPTRHKPIVMILLDGFSRTYLSSSGTPGLSDLARNGAEIELDNLFAFRGIEASLFSGKSIQEHGIWVEYSIANDWLTGVKHRLPYHTESLLKGIDQRGWDYVSKAMRTVLQRWYPEFISTRTPNIIPANLIGCFQECAVDGRDYFGRPLDTIYDALARAGASYLNLMPPRFVDGEEILRRIKSGLMRGERHEFYYIKLSAPDTVGHRFGPNSPEMDRAISRTDDMVASILAVMQGVLGKIQAVVISDHGMSEVTELVDLTTLVHETGLMVPEDFVYFLDSTVARFWCRNQASQNDLRSLLEDLSELREVDDERRNEIGIQGTGRGYGDLIYDLREGFAFSPDFYRHSEKPRGMHGYGTTSSDRPILLLYPRPDFELPQRIAFEGVRPVVERLAELYSQNAGGLSVKSSSTHRG